MQNEIRRRVVRGQIVFPCPLVISFSNREADSKEWAGPAVMALLVCLGAWQRSVADAFGTRCVDGIHGDAGATHRPATIRRDDARDRVRGSGRCCEAGAVGACASTTCPGGESRDETDHTGDQWL